MVHEDQPGVAELKPGPPRPFETIHPTPQYGPRVVVSADSAESPPDEQREQYQHLVEAPVPFQA